MSIKQSIAALFLLMSVSFSASADLYEIRAVKWFPGVYSSKEEYASKVLGQCIPLAAPYSFKATKWYEAGSNSIKFVGTEYKELDGDACGKSWNSNKDINITFYIVEQCPIGEELNPATGQCEPPPPTCEELKAKDAPAPDFIPEDGQALTATRYYCDTSNMCEAQQSYFASAGDLVKENYYTGNDCVGSEEDYTNDPYYPPVTEPTDPIDPTDPTDPTHNPEDPTGEIFDPSPLPDSSTGSVPPIETEDEETVEDPLTDPNIDSSSTDTAVVKAITGMNSDVNSALNNLNLDINQNGADIQNQLLTLNHSVVQNSQTIQEQQKNDNKIYENTKALIQQANADITTAVNKNTNAINALGDDVEAIGEGVAGIGESIDGLANLDLSGSLNGTCPYNSESQTCTGYYEVGYPNGFEGLVDGHFSQLESNVTGIVDGMFALDVSNGVAPSFCMNVMQFGRHCFTDYFDLASVFAFIRACMMFGTVMLCRKLVFGG